MQTHVRARQVCTDPRFGRTEEVRPCAQANSAPTRATAPLEKILKILLLAQNFGEDPAHVSAFAVAAVTGLQGGSAKPSTYLPDNDHIVCEAKHCCAYGAGGRDGNSADISPKTLHDVYLRPWDAFVEAGGRGMMLSHNELNGIQMHANHEIMTEHFREGLGYEGLFASDLGNIEAIWYVRPSVCLCVQEPGLSACPLLCCRLGAACWLKLRCVCICRENSNVAANYSDAVALSLWVFHLHAELSCHTKFAR